MEKTVDRKSVIISIVLIFLVLAMPAFAAEKTRAGDLSQRFKGPQAVLNKVVEKVGFFDGVANGRVSLIEEGTYRKLSYLAAPGMLVTKQGQEIDLLKVWPASIVKLLIVDVEVVEIILIQESS